MGKIKSLIYLATVLTIPSIAYAHLIGGIGLASGSVHPLSGLDHLLAMIAVGIISTRYDGKAVWLIPAVFLASMIAGGILAITGIHISLVEIGIALSVVFLGMAVFLQKKMPFYLVLVFVALSAIFHGHAHGEEMPLIASPVLYSLGFVLSTAMLHISGVLIGHYAKKTEIASKLLRYAGAGVGIAGVLFLAGLL